MANLYNLVDADGNFILRINGEGEFVTSSSQSSAAKVSASDANRIIRESAKEGIEITRILATEMPRSEKILPILKTWRWTSDRNTSDDRQINHEFRAASDADWYNLASEYIIEMCSRMGEQYRDLAGEILSNRWKVMSRKLSTSHTPGQKMRYIHITWRNNSMFGSEIFGRFMNARIDMGIVGTKDTYGEDARRQAQDPNDSRPTGKEFSEGGISVDEKVKSSGSDSQNVSVADRIADAYAEDPLMEILRKSVQADQWATFEFLLSLPDGAREEIVKGKPSWIPLRSELRSIVEFIILDDMPLREGEDPSTVERAKPKPSLSGAMKAIIGEKEWNPSREKKVRVELQSLFIRAFGDEVDSILADPKNPKAPFVATASLNHAGFKVSSTWKGGSPEFMKAGK